MRAVATIEIDRDRETSRRATIYVARESRDGHWVWCIYAKARGEEPVLYETDRSRQDALESVRLLWGEDWDLQWTEGGRQ